MSEDDTDELIERIEEFADILDERFELFEERQDSLERLHANLMMAYTELASTVESVIAEVMAPRTEEERNAFRKQLQERHQETLEMIRDVSSQAVERDPSDHVSRSFSEVVKQPEGDKTNG